MKQLQWRSDYPDCNVGSRDETNYGSKEEGMVRHINDRRCNIDECIWQGWSQS